MEAFLETSGGGGHQRPYRDRHTLAEGCGARVLAVTLRNASTAVEGKGIVIEVSQTSAPRSAAKSYVDYDEIAWMRPAISS